MGDPARVRGTKCDMREGSIRTTSGVKGPILPGRKDHPSQKVYRKRRESSKEKRPREKSLRPGIHRGRFAKASDGRREEPAGD